MSGPKFINWNLDLGGGGAIDLVMHVRQVGFGQALEWLEDHFGAFTPLGPQAMPQVLQSLALPARVAGNWPQVERYLIEERKLPAMLLQSLIQSGALYADARANAVFLLLDTAGTPVGAELRGTTACAWRAAWLRVPAKTVASSPCLRLSLMRSFSVSPPLMPSVVMPSIPITAAFPPPAPGLTQRGCQR